MSKKDRDNWESAARALGGRSPDFPDEQATAAVLVACRNSDEQGWSGPELAQVIDMLGPDVTSAAHRIAGKSTTTTDGQEPHHER